MENKSKDIPAYCSYCDYFIEDYETEIRRGICKHNMFIVDKENYEDYCGSFKLDKSQLDDYNEWRNK